MKPCYIALIEKGCQAYKGQGGNFETIKMNGFGIDRLQYSSHVTLWQWLK
jgi:hypothetical protein